MRLSYKNTQTNVLYNLSPINFEHVSLKLGGNTIKHELRHQFLITKVVLVNDNNKKIMKKKSIENK